MSIGRNTALNIAGSVAPLAVSLVCVPLFVRAIGENRYGVLAIVWLLLGYFGLFDLGLGRAVAQRVAALIDATPQSRANVIVTACIVSGGLGILGGLTLWAAASFVLGRVVRVDTMIQAEARAALAWLVLATPVVTLSSALNGVLQGRERFGTLNAVSVTTSIGLQVVPLVTALGVSPNLAVLIAVSVIVRAASIPLLWFTCSSELAGGRFDRREAGNLLGFGGWVTTTSVVGPFMVALDRLLIGGVRSAKAVAHYSIPFQLVQQLTVISAALGGAILPRLTAATADVRRRLTSDAMAALSSLLGTITVFGIFAVHPFLEWWLGSTFVSQSATVAILLLPGFWVNSLARLSVVHLQSIGRPDIVARCHIGEVIPYVLGLYFAVKFFGSPGAAAAFGVRAFVDFLLLEYNAGTLRATWISVRLSAFTQLMATFLALSLQVWSTYWLASAVVLLTLTFMWSWRSAPLFLRERLVDYVRGTA